MVLMSHCHTLVSPLLTGCFRVSLGAPGPLPTLAPTPCSHRGVAAVFTITFFVRSV